FPLPVTGRLAWCYANAHDIGFYRPQLDTALMSALLAHLDRLEAGEQMGLLRDQAALMASGSQSMSGFLEVLDALTASNDYRVIGQVVEQLGMLERFLDEAGDVEALAGFRAWVGATFRAKLAAFGFEPHAGDSPDDAVARARVVAAMTHFAHDAGAIEQARAWAAREAEDPTAVDPNLAPVVVGASAQFGDAALFERYLALYQQRKDAGAAPTEVDRYLNSFGRFQPQELVARALQLLDEGIVQLPNWPNILVPLLTEPRSQATGWEFLKAHWDFIAERARFFIPPMVSFTGQLSASLRGDVVAFFDTHLHGEFAVPYARALEQIDQLAELKARTRNDLIAWFRARPTSGSNATARS
ncbi:MAG TPA: ERAP1-like C-terminal domain-containing protein, partial [Ktedonobacterales bacterium]|nr:ERAP1-like C-terminal domain-containing protein [Ktedonobacterales bacterium]